MHDDVDGPEGAGLWDEAWSRPGPQREEPLRPREQWSPGTKAHSRNSSTDGTRPRRRVVPVGDRDAHLTFEPPAEYRVDTRKPGSGRPGSRNADARKAGAGRGPARPPRDTTRALGPRGTVVGYRHDRSPLLTFGLLVAAALVVATAGALAWGALSRPAAFAIAPTPADAVVTVAGHGSRTGRFALDGLDPGVVTATVGRSGFETATVTLTVGRGETVERSIALTPRAFKLTLKSRPKGATVTVKSADGTSRKGTTPCSLETSAGPLSITIVKSGYEALSQKLFLAGPRTVDVPLDPKG